jgi:coproporphyrinogen III oxidase
MSTNTPDIAKVKTWLTSLQERIVSAAEKIDGKQFIRDSWERPEGGGGVSRLIEEGNVLERGGVGFSHVKGMSLPPSGTVAVLKPSRWSVASTSGPETSLVLPFLSTEMVVAILITQPIRR